MPEPIDSGGYFGQPFWQVNPTTGLAVASAASGSGIVATANFTPAAGAYDAGDIIQTAKEFAFTFAQSGAAIPAGSLIRILSTALKIGVTAVPSGMTSFSLKTYLSAPATASQGDNNVWSLQAADVSIYKGSIALGTPVDEGAGLYIETQYVDKDVKLTTSSLYGTLVTAGAHTAAAVAREVILRGILI